MNICPKNIGRKSFVASSALSQVPQSTLSVHSQNTDTLRFVISSAGVPNINDFPQEPRSDRGFLDVRGGFGWCRFGDTRVLQILSFHSDVSFPHVNKSEVLMLVRKEQHSYAEKLEMLLCGRTSQLS